MLTTVLLYCKHLLIAVEKTFLLLYHAEKLLKTLRWLKHLNLFQQSYW